MPPSNEARIFALALTQPAAERTAGSTANATVTQPCANASTRANRTPRGWTANWAGHHNNHIIFTDGVFAESKEAIAGCFRLGVSSADEAMRLAQACPILACGAQIEVRPIADLCRPMAEAKTQTKS